MSTILGIISLVSLICVIVFSSKNGGNVPFGYGVTGILALIFSVVGLVLGIVTVQNKGYYRLFPVLGIALNFIVLATLGLILYAGAGL